MFSLMEKLFLNYNAIQVERNQLNIDSFIFNLVSRKPYSSRQKILENSRVTHEYDHIFADWDQKLSHDYTFLKNKKNTLFYNLNNSQLFD